MDRPSWVIDELEAPTGKGVRIGVIDSGWDRTTPDPRVVAGLGLVDPEDELALAYSRDDHDQIGHGTACSDLILRQAPGAEIVPLRIFGHRLETSVPLLQAALEWAIENELRLVNISLGTYRLDALRPLYTVCEHAVRQGMIIVAAVHSRSLWSYPSVFENVLSVGMGPLKHAFQFYYRPDHAVECLAKGRQRVRWLAGKTRLKVGTSFAAPNITGIVALLLERYPEATLADVRALLERYAEKGVEMHGGNRLH